MSFVARGRGRLGAGAGAAGWRLHVLLGVGDDVLLGFGDDGVGVAAEVGELGVQGLGVGAGDVGPAEADDEVGDTLVFQAAHAVGGVGVGGDHVDLEGAAFGAFL